MGETKYYVFVKNGTKSVKREDVENVLNQSGVSNISVMDHAQLVEKSPGGIDFNTDRMNLQVQNSGGEIKFKIDSAMLQQLRNASGFVPVIINVQPLHDLQLFLSAK